MQEWLFIVITDEDVTNFDWYDCANVVETVTDNTDLAPFDEILKALIDQIYNKNPNVHKTIESEKITVISAELRMGYFNIEDNKQEGLMVPVWVFQTTGTSMLPKEFKETTTNGQHTVEGFDDVFIINAMDGGVIGVPF